MDYQKELIEEFTREIALTRKMLAAIPEDADLTWKPHPKSYSLGRLAAHVAEIPGEWALCTLQQDKLEFNSGEYKPSVMSSKADLLARFDKDTAEASAALAALDQAKWDQTWTMGGDGQVWISDSRYRVWRTWVISHGAHHRAQLGVDLRLLNLKVPGTYGPSADEM
jgi:uncharacterized damage-inducible protein DinB